jgi:hypothetical protein
MNDPTYIQYFQQPEIDKSKWDSCIEQATNGLVYAYSFYLDAMSKNWDALVLNDYEAVMPLTWNKKYGIYYLYQPFLTAQSGVFGNTINAALLEQFLKAIPQKFQYWDICLNQGNVFPIANFPLFQRNNFILDLNKPYTELYNAYNENIRRNVKKAEQTGCIIQKDFHIENVIELASEQMKQFAHNSEDGLERFKKLFPLLHQKGMATTYGVFLNQQLMASCVILYSHRRIFYVLVGNHPDGKTIGASHAVIDAIIKDHAGKNLLLDFEGSDIPSLAFFYSSFGSLEEKYAAIRLNRLPFYLKWMKK